MNIVLNLSHAKFDDSIMLSLSSRAGCELEQVFVPFVFDIPEPFAEQVHQKTESILNGVTGKITYVMYPVISQAAVMLARKLEKALGYNPQMVRLRYTTNREKQNKKYIVAEVIDLDEFLATGEK